MGEATQIIRKADAHEVLLLAHLIRNSYRDVAARFNLTPQQQDLEQWYERMGFVEQEIKIFPHLPFKVSLMACTF